MSSGAAESATGWCRNFVQIVSARFLFGVGAAGAYPNIAGAISRWFPRREHAGAQGFVWGAIAGMVLIAAVLFVRVSCSRGLANV
ncbi:MAG TPA: hypothetical protein VHY48_13780 [Acidobacteriaceae bacterium]|nr:hypothetical protein [Acidobacteriaceae bacterium]